MTFKDTDTKTAHWKCDGCGAVRTQNKRQAKAIHCYNMTPSAVFVLDFQYVYGPFPDLETAKEWVRAPHYTFGSPTYFALGALQRIGSAETADAVGVVYS